MRQPGPRARVRAGRDRRERGLPGPRVDGADALPDAPSPPRPHEAVLPVPGVHVPGRRRPGAARASRSTAFAALSPDVEGRTGRYFGSDCASSRRTRRRPTRPRSGVSSRVRRHPEPALYISKLEIAPILSVLRPGAQSAAAA